jgi:cytochrome c553
MAPEDQIMNGLSTRALVVAGAIALGVSLAAGGFPRSGPAPGPVSADLVVAAQRRNAAADLKSLEHGRSQYIATCARCHGLPDIAAVKADNWPKILDRMASKADLDPQSAADVKLFVLSVSDTAKPSP